MKKEKTPLIIVYLLFFGILFFNFLSRPSGKYTIPELFAMPFQIKGNFIIWMTLALTLLFFYILIKDVKTTNLSRSQLFRIYTGFGLLAAMTGLTLSWTMGILFLALFSDFPFQNILRSLFWTSIILIFLIYKTRKIKISYN